MSIKINLMVDHIKNNKSNYNLLSKKNLKDYIIKKYKCSSYMAETTIEKLFNS
jgi:hypothetical protein